MLSLPTLLPWPTPNSPFCPPSQLPIHLPSPFPGSHHPWTHPPRCMTTPNRHNNTKLCIFTSTTFNPPLGLSIVASPAAASDLIRAGLLTSGTQPPEEEKEEVKYEPRTLPGMGIGLFVKPGKRFSPGEVILVDRPTLMLPVPDGGGDAEEAAVEELAWQGVMQLPARGRGLTRGLAREMGGDELVDVVDTNAFSQVKGGRGWNLVFPRAARMNHDCVPNAITRTNDTTLTLTVVALRPILAGEQIVNSYLDPSPPSLSRERLATLRDTWGFTCACAICSGRAVVESDERRRQIVAAQAELQDTNGDAAEIFRLAKEVLGLMDAEGMVIPRGEYLDLAAMGARYLGLGDDVVRWARRARGHWDLVMGEGSAEAGAMEELEGEIESMRG